MLRSFCLGSDYSMVMLHGDKLVDINEHIALRSSHQFDFICVTGILHQLTNAEFSLVTTVLFFL